VLSQTLTSREAPLQSVKSKTSITKALERVSRVARDVRVVEKRMADVVGGSGKRKLEGCAMSSVDVVCFLGRKGVIYIHIADTFRTFLIVLAVISPKTQCRRPICQSSCPYELPQDTGYTRRCVRFWVLE
jgi:hypothetical protein